MGPFLGCLGAQHSLPQLPIQSSISRSWPWLSHRLAQLCVLTAPLAAWVARDGLPGALDCTGAHAVSSGFSMDSSWSAGRDAGNSDSSLSSCTSGVLRVGVSLPESQTVHRLQNGRGWRASLVVQWLRLRAPNGGDPSSIPGQETRSCKLQLKPGTAT